MTNRQTNGNDPQYWSMYPTNVHMHVKGVKGGGSSLQSKKIVTVVVLVVLTIALTIGGYVLGKDYGFGLLSGAIALVLGIVLSMFLYSKIVRDRLNEAFESDPENKVLKLFRIRLNDGDVEQISKHKVDLMSYTNGELFVTLRIEIGNSNFASEVATGDFLDRLFKSAHQLQLKVKNYNVPAEWRKSDVYHNHLRRLTKVTDPKLRNTLAVIDAHQSKTFDEAIVNSIHITFVTRRNNIGALESIIDMTEDWRKDFAHMASIRKMDWLTHKETVDSLCQFLTIQMLDVTSNMNKKNIKYDVRKMVRVYSADRFKPSEDIEVESRASLLKKDRRKK